jgi:putative Mg2+ transporter-C (MgtC) family protein
VFETFQMATLQHEAVSAWHQRRGAACLYSTAGRLLWFPVSSISTFEAIIRILVAAGLGSVVGWERQFRGHPVGDRTFSLVCIGAAGFTVAAIPFPADAGKVIAGIVTGVGFIGGGLVFRQTDSGEVHGMTTAVGVWAMVAVGVLAGIGRLALASSTAVLVLVILELRHLPVVNRLDARRFMKGHRRDEDPPSGMENAAGHG